MSGLLSEDKLMSMTLGRLGERVSVAIFKMFVPWAFQEPKKKTGGVPTNLPNFCVWPMKGQYYKTCEKVDCLEIFRQAGDGIPPVIYIVRVIVKIRS